VTAQTLWFPLIHLLLIYGFKRYLDHPLRHSELALSSLFSVFFETILWYRLLPLVRLILSTG
jgi:hypothetical protein